jgi:drug/metabolite transporter (DMT)-like permease
MIWKRMLNKLHVLNVPQSLVIVSILTLPMVIILNRSPIDYIFARTMARIAVFYFSAAFLLYIFLYGISHLPNIRIRKSLVIFTRVYIRFHIAMAIVGTLFIVLHATLMLKAIPVTSPRAITGLLSMLSLFAVLTTGYLRKRRSSGKRRRFHRYMAFIFITFVIIHLIV